MRWTTVLDRRPALVVTTLAALALGWFTGANGGTLETLLGAGPMGFAAIWGCSVCLGKGALMVMGGPSGTLLRYVMGAANLGTLTACVGMCAAALTM